jgi:hypothetical protein
MRSFLFEEEGEMKILEEKATVTVTLKNIMLPPIERLPWEKFEKYNARPFYWRFYGMLFHLFTYSSKIKIFFNHFANLHSYQCKEQIKKLSYFLQLEFRRWH